MDVRLRDKLRAVVTDPSDERLDTLLQFGDMAEEMAGRQGTRRKQFTRDTAQAIKHTCYGLVSLCRNLLGNSHEYVCFGHFSTDPLEKEFSKLRQGSGGTYFINVQQIVEKTNINKAKLLLSLDASQVDNAPDSGHACSKCPFSLQANEQAAEVFDNLEELESSIDADTKTVLVHIAGYVTRNDAENENETTFYYEMHGGFTESLNRGGLKIPTDSACQWTIFCYIIFLSVKYFVCRKSFSKLAMQISKDYNFDMSDRHGNILANTFLKRLSLISTPRSSKEPAMKVLKLS